MGYGRDRRRRVWLRAVGGVLGAAAIGAAVWAAAAVGSAGAASPIKIGILSDCAGPFGGQYNADIGGAEAAFAQFAGAKLNNPNDPSRGFTGGSGARASAGGLWPGGSPVSSPSQ